MQTIAQPTRPLSRQLRMINGLLLACPMTRKSRQTVTRIIDSRSLVVIHGAFKWGRILKWSGKGLDCHLLRNGFNLTAFWEQDLFQYQGHCVRRIIEVKHCIPSTSLIDKSFSLLTLPDSLRDILVDSGDERAHLLRNPHL